MRAMRRTVLIVDDHAGFRRRARELLEASGYEVVGEAADGASALTEADRLRPEITLVDVQLPDLDGFAVARRLRAVGSTRTVVLISSRELADYGSRADHAHADGFISKADLSGETLLAIVGA
jgi:DNA-binding NarL/FixJ family response regulator